MINTTTAPAHINFLCFSLLSSTKKPPTNSFPRTATTTLSSSLGRIAAASPLRQREGQRLGLAKANPSGEQKWTHEGSITESLPNGMFRVRLDNKDVIIGYISGKIRKNFVRILPGDRVKVEVSRYDSSRGRIVYRLRNKGSAADD